MSPLLVAAITMIWFAAAFSARNPEGNTGGEYKLVRWVTANGRNTVLCVLAIVAVYSLVLRIMTLRSSSGSGGMSSVNYGVSLMLVAVITYLVVYRLRHTRWKYAAIAVFALATVAWVLWPGWLTIDVLAALLGVGLLANAVHACISFRFAITFSGAMFLYDILHVYVTGWMHGIMAPTYEEQSPLLLIMPQSLSLEAGTLNLLGLGDILVPGFIILTAAVLAYRRGVMSLLYGGLAGYAVGLSIAGLLYYVFQTAQPALISLYPCTVGSILLVAWRAGLVRVLFAQRLEPVRLRR